MPKLPRVSGADAIRALAKLGFIKCASVVVTSFLSGRI